MTWENGYSPYLGPILEDDPRPVVLVYCIGKAASKTIAETLYPFSRFKVFHIQKLNPLEICEQHATSITASDDITRVVAFNEELKNFIDRRYFANRWHIITVVRDPMAMALSSVFELWWGGVFDAYSPAESTRLRYVGDNHDSLLSFFESEFNWDPIITYIAGWFNRELSVTFAIDITKLQLNKDRGFTIHKIHNVSLLALGVEDLNTVYPSAFKAFLDLDVPCLKCANEAKNKSYASVYEGIRRQIRPRPALLDRLYSAPWVRTFYSEERIAGFRHYWETSPRTIA